MLSFNPGPSKLHSGVRAAMQDAYDSGLLAASHRSAQFQATYALVVEGFQTKLGMPADYQLYFLGSATECWSVLSESLVREASFHLHSGSFGERWLEYARALYPESFGLHWAADIPFSALALPAMGGVDLVAITQNETSTGHQLQPQHLRALRQAAPNALLAVDATSSLGGLDLPLAEADIWFASVQKCFGLPAGLAVMIVSPRAQERISALNRTVHYNSLTRIHKQALQLQTNYTPNVLGIYLLSRVLSDIPDIAQVAQRIRNQAQAWYALFENHPHFQPFVPLVENRSDTVIHLQGAAEQVQAFKQRCTQVGITIGSGYGPHKTTGLRIANFPAHTEVDISRLQAVFSSFAKIK